MSDGSEKPDAMPEIFVITESQLIDLRNGKKSNDPNQPAG
jgi:hypothetical protein